ncbi:MAG: GNAT family N-acetyltransferase [Deltaproteobacteria bacterium]|nr:GNAT family N-acetyltransferase [Deltaproteobacteria bacterium]
MQLLHDEPIIEHAVPSDMEAILTLWAKLMRLTSEFNARYMLAPGARSIQRSYLMGFFESPAAAIFVARVRGEVAGFVNLYVTKPAQVFEQESIGVIENIYVTDEHRLAGIGRALVERSVHFFQNSRVDDVYVNVIPANRSSEEFWRHMGFELNKVTMFRRVRPA